MTTLNEVKRLLKIAKQEERLLKQMIKRNEPLPVIDAQREAAYAAGEACKQALIAQHNEMKVLIDQYKERET